MGRPVAGLTLILEHELVGHVHGLFEFDDAVSGVRHGYTPVIAIVYRTVAPGV